MPSMVVHGFELAVKMHGYDGYAVFVGFTLTPSSNAGSWQRKV